MAKKIYAVRKGLVPGVYENWDECKRQVDGYSGAEYKSFTDSFKAYEYMGTDIFQFESTKKPELKKIWPTDQFTPAHAAAYTIMNQATECIKKAAELYVGLKEVDIYTDGSFKNGRYSYAYVVVAEDTVIHQENGLGTDAGAATMQNVAGELSAAMNAICWARNHGYTCRLFHDYEGVGHWATGSWKAKNKHTKAYVQFIKENPDIVSEFIHVYGHTGNKYNELADQLAGQAF